MLRVAPESIYELVRLLAQAFLPSRRRALDRHGPLRPPHLSPVLTLTRGSDPLPDFTVAPRRDRVLASRRAPRHVLPSPHNRIACLRRRGFAPSPDDADCVAQLLRCTNKKGRPLFGSGLSLFYIAGPEPEARSLEPSLPARRLRRDACLR